MPGDFEILLYKARCYRNFRDSQSLRQAEEIVGHVEKHVSSPWFIARLYREKGLIAEQVGDLPRAKKSFRMGIDIGPVSGYPDNHVAYAQTVLREAEGYPPGSEERQELAKEGVTLLEMARHNSATFDRYHLSTYVEALAAVGDEKSALNLLTEALEERPEDARLYYRMAELRRERREYTLAEEYATKALHYGAAKARLTLANIYCSSGIDLFSAGREDDARGKIRLALSVLEIFRPEFGSDQEVADGIRAKAFRLLGDWERAGAAIQKYEATGNSFTLYERCQIHLGKAEAAASDAHDSIALAELGALIQRVERFRSQKKLPRPIQEILERAKTRMQQIQAAIGGPA